MEYGIQARCPSCGRVAFIDDDAEDMPEEIMCFKCGHVFYIVLDEYENEAD